MRAKKPLPLITCPGCHEVKPSCTHGLCKKCYMKEWRATTQRAKQASITPRNGLGRCLCKQPATQKVFLSFGGNVKGSSKGAYYNLCDKCVKLEKEQEGLRG